MTSLDRIRELSKRYKSIGGLDVGQYSELMRLLLSVFDEWQKKCEASDQGYQIYGGMEREFNTVRVSLRRITCGKPPAKVEQEKPCETEQQGQMELFELEAR